MQNVHSRRVLRFDSGFAAEGCGIALTGDEYKCRLPASASHAFFPTLIVILGEAKNLGT